MEMIFLPLKRFADFGGRSRRREFWAWVLFVWAAMFLLMYLDAVLGLGGSATGYAEGGSVGFNMKGGLLTLLFAAAILVPNLSVSVRRLHDVGKSGWLLLLWLIPLLGWLYLLYLYLQPGIVGPNAYGADPKGGDASRVFA